MSDINHLACLSGIPWHIKQRIVGYSDVFSRSTLRCVSKDFRAYADEFPIEYKTLEFLIDRNRAKITLTSSTDVTMIIEYQNSETSFSRREDFNHYVFEGPDHLKRAVSSLRRVFRSPEVVVKSLEINYTEYMGTPEHLVDKAQILETMAMKFLFLGRPLHIEKLRVKSAVNEDEVMCLLPYLETEHLRRVRVEGPDLIDEQKLNNVMRTFITIVRNSPGTTTLEVDYGDLAADRMDSILGSFAPVDPKNPNDRFVRLPKSTFFLRFHFPRNIVFIRAQRDKSVEPIMVEEDD